MKRVPSNRYVIFGLIVIAGVTIDLWTKHVVFTDLGYPRGRNAYQAGEHSVFDRPARQEGQSREYLQGWVRFRLYNSFNHGALWGIGQNLTAVFVITSMAAGIGIVVWLFVFSAAQSRWLTVALAMIMSGTVGNLWDRLAMHGCTDLQDQPVHAVRDFLLFTFGDYHYPIFNFADAFLVTGAVMLIVQSLFLTPPAPAEAAGGDSSEQQFAESSTA